MAKVRKERLDLLLVERGLAESRQQAQRLIMAGQVTVDGGLVDKPGSRVPAAAGIEVDGGLPYVSRGGYKLEAALDAFGLDVAGLVAADVGASTGGFTDCLLQRGAARVYAIDVGYGQLAWKLQQDPRVVVMDRVNARYLERLPEAVDLATADTSFISLRLILPAVMGWLVPGGQIVALIKPQFEAGRRQVGKGGVVRDPAVHRSVLAGVLDWAGERGLGLMGLVRSPITGPAGNVEFLAHWRLDREPEIDVELAIDHCLE
jgi:23S rRNA (cytidine1920-2'-O)/16S rRNA (cytidine1409-2'-O)-methyltransferase